ncbi:MAG: ABC transporter permease [Flavobacteriales bacterium]|nr:ABC transporter permease [Flavobacteriales bacterium]MBK9059194.1 ABC transporter permease [Flavobacteriales bacterium]MBK9597865.1 ABC transporter permease [Flavobacteriales bacterium]QQS73835.1 MAG: ABC transporter permease [Flavobacteriales bacterium]HQV38956.1 FtsX-like permease family protein [Flavobacteriales bacterium]
MKLALQLAYRNLVGAGLRTWLNVIVLAFAFLMIIFFNGLMDGWDRQARRDSIAMEFGNGQLLHPDYDPYDPFSIQDGHGVLNSDQADKLTPILIRQASVYPQGRMVSALLKGIPVDQRILTLPTAELKKSDAAIPVMIGKRMAASLNVKEGDKLLLRWRDKNGTFDAADMTVVHIFQTDVPAVDKGSIWLPMDKLEKMTGLVGHASEFILSEGFDPSDTGGWTYKSQAMLLQDITDIIAMKKTSSSVLYLMLVAIALIAIFDTQVLSVFRRQREIGTYVALGMTRTQVVGLFTVEGSMYSLLAMAVGCIVGIPLFVYLATTGIAFPTTTMAQDMGVAISDRIFPVFGVQLVLGTVLLVVIAATIVSFLPARKIARMNAVEALKGKLQ